MNSAKSDYNQLRLTAYIILLTGVIITSVWSFIRNVITLPYLVFFVTGSGAFIVWNLMARSKMIKNNIQDLFSQAENAAKHKKWQRAIYSYDEILKINPQSFEAIIGRAEAFKNLSGYREALPLLKDILKQYPNKAEVHHLLGLCYFESRLTEEALDHLNSALQIAPSRGETCILMGDIYKMEKNYEQAEQYYRKALNNIKDDSLKASVKEKLNSVTEDENAKESFDN